MRMAKFYDNKIHTRKWVITYIVTGLLCAALWLGISLVCQLPIGTDSVTFATNLTLSFKFLGEVLLFTLIIGIFVAAFIFSICAIFINFRNIDKPYRFFKTEEYDDFEEQRDEEVEKKRVFLLTMLGLMVLQMKCLLEPKNMFFLDYAQ